MELTKKDYKKTFAMLGLSLCALEGCGVLGSLAYSGIEAWLRNQEAGAYRWLSWLFYSGWTDTLVQYAFALGLPYLAAAAVLRFVPKEARGKTKLPPEVFAVCLLIALGMGYALNFVGSAINMAVSLATGKSFYEMNPVMDMMSALTPSMIIYTCLLGPFMEELLFRGMLLSRARRFGDRTAVLFTAVLFGLTHGNLSQFLYATAVGLVLGYIAVRTGRLRYNVILHILVNSHSVLLLLGQNALAEACMSLPLIGYSLAVLFFVVLLSGTAGVLVIRCAPIGWRQMTAADRGPSPWKKYVWLNAGFLLYSGVCILKMLFYLLY